MENNDWLINRIAYLKGLQSCSDQQKLLILLAEKPDRSAQDIKRLTVLIRAEKAGNKISRARQLATSVINAEIESGGKTNNHRLLLQGKLIDLAGLASRSRSELLGLLLTAAANDDPLEWANWEAKGNAMLRTNVGAMAKGKRYLEAVYANTATEVR